MISVIIPLMPLKPYDTQIVTCLESLKKQSAEHEVIVEEQKIERFIAKNKLLNQGVEKAKGDIIWFCDADFILHDDTLLERMETDLEDVIYPMFFSPVFEGYKIADGAPFIKKDVLSRFGKLDETLMGIGGVTFPLLSWCLSNTVFCCSSDYLFRLNYMPFTMGLGKTQQVTRERTKDLVEKTETELKDMGLWPKREV